MIVPLLAAALATAPGTTEPPADLLRAEASLPILTDLEVGGTYELRVELICAPGWSVGTGGIPKAIVQIEVPPSIELDGAVLRTHRELASNEFLEAPYERLAELGVTDIPFRLVSVPAPNEHLAVNVIAYVGAEDASTDDAPADDAWFARRRLELPVSRGAADVSTDQADVSDWGRGERLQIGAPAAGFTLPRADGSTLDLSQHLGRRPVIVTTYRAFW